MEPKTRNVLFYVAAGLIIAGAIIGVIVDVNGGADVEPVDSVAVEVVDTVQPQALDTVAADTLVVDSVVAE